MSQPDTCAICGQPLADHQMQLRWGIIHAGVWIDGHFRSCTDLNAEYHYNAAQRQTLTTLVRSLRWHAGRLRTKGKGWTADDLDEQSIKVAKRIEMLERQVDLYYSWARKKD